MTNATHADVIKRFPGMPDHTVVEILALDPTEAELDAVQLLAASDDEHLIGFKQQDADRLNRLMAIIEASGMGFEDDRD